jgi:uncharacterized membrane protein
MSDDRHPRHGTQRVEAFSDGVFAIAITLLIIEIGVPHVRAGGDLGGAIQDLWPSYFAYILSFVTIGIYWTNHHSLFHLFDHTDHQFLVLNVFFLMTVSFLPFPTAVLGEFLKDSHHQETAITFYAFGVLLPAVGWFVVWAYGVWRGLLVHDIDPGYVRGLTLQYAGTVLLYVFALALVLVSEWATLAVAAGLTALYLLPPRQPRYTS